MNLSWMYWFLLKPVNFSKAEILQVTSIQLRAGCDHGVVDLIDLILDIGFEVFVEDRVTERVVLVQEDVGKRPRRG